jgi:uncharacterized membrane protein
MLTNAYNRIAGHSIERLSALSDGVFAVAMTLLVLDIHVPPSAGIHSEGELWRAVLALYPNFVPYAMSFLTLGILWLGQQTGLSYMAKADRDLAWINLAFLAIVTVLPFSTALLAEYIEYRTALITYWLNVLAGGIALYASWWWAHRAHLLKEGTGAEVSTALYRRIVIAQCMYALGAALCVISTYWSIGFIMMVQLYYALAPGFRRRHGS